MSVQASASTAMSEVQAHQEQPAADDPIVQWVVLRRDLWTDIGWPLGPVIAQACHASSAAMFTHLDDPVTQQYIAQDNIDHMHKVRLNKPATACPAASVSHGASTTHKLPGGRLCLRLTGGAATVAAAVNYCSAHSKQPTSIASSLKSTVCGEELDASDTHLLSSLAVKGHAVFVQVVLEVKSEQQLVNLSKKLEQEGILHKLWIEQPENYPTCLATKPYQKSQAAALFKKLQLCKAALAK